MQIYVADVQVAPGWTGNQALTVFFSGCDFKCPHCNTPSLLEFKQETLVELRMVKSLIKSSPLQHVFFTGGEPCVQRTALTNLARAAKDKGMKVGLDTNGSRPETLLGLLHQQVVDYVCFDYKAPLNKQFQEVTRAGTFFKPVQDVILAVEQSLSLLRKHQHDVAVDIKTVIVPGLLFRKEELYKIAERLDWFNGRWVLTPFSPVNTHAKWQSIEPPGELFMEQLVQDLQEKYPHLHIALEPASHYTPGSHLRIEE